MAHLGRNLMLMGGLLFAIGLLLALGDRLPFRLGRLPGDFSWRGRNGTLYFPLTTSVLLSLLGTLLLWLWNRK